MVALRRARAIDILVQDILVQASSDVNKPRKSPEQLGRMLWEALRAEQPPGFRDCAIRVVRARRAAADWDAELVAKPGPDQADLDRVFARAKAQLQEQYSWRDD